MKCLVRKICPASGSISFKLAGRCVTENKLAAACSVYFIFSSLKKGKELQLRMPFVAYVHYIRGAKVKNLHFLVRCARQLTS